MRKFILLAMAVLMGVMASAQTERPKEEVKRLRKLIKKTNSRTPLPRLMSDDRSCVDELYDLPKWDRATAKLKDDSIQKRHEENIFIQEHQNWAGEYLLKSGKYHQVVSQILREELRYDMYERECRIMASEREADQRPEPKGELLSVGYSSSGMSYHPDLPFTITKTDGDSALVTYSYKNLHFKVDGKYLDMMREAIINEHLYQLHGGYYFKSWDLPDIPKDVLLDGQKWSFEAKFSDGTVISSSGMYSPEQNVGAIPKIYFDSVFPNSAAYKARMAKKKAGEGQQ